MANLKNASRRVVFALALAVPILSSVRMLAAQEPKQPVTAQDDKQTVTLEPGAKPIERDLKGGEKQAFKVHVDSGQFVHFVVKQLGIDVALTLYAPDGKKIASMDSPNDTTGLEQISTIAHTSGDYRLEVFSEDKAAKAGRYTAKVAPLRRPHEKDRKRIAAERGFFEAVGLHDRSDPDSIRMAIQRCLEVLPLWHEAVDQYEEALTLDLIGTSYSSLGDNQKTIEYYMQALPLMRAVGDRLGEANTLAGIASAYDHLGEGGLQKALDYNLQALPLILAVSDQSREADMLRSIGYEYYFLGDNHKALKYYLQALPLMRSLADRSREANVLGYIGMIYSGLEETQKALEYDNQLLTLMRATGDRSGEASTLLGISRIYSAIGEKGKAFEFLGQAVPQLLADPDRYHQAMSLGYIGDAYSDLGENQKAIDYYNQRLSLWRAAGDRSGEAVTLQRIGGEYSALGENQKALEYYNLALPLLRTIADPFDSTVILAHIGSTYSALGEKQKALDFVDQARSLQQHIGDRRLEADMLRVIGDAYSDLGVNQKALECYNNALSLTRAIADRFGEANTLNDLGLAYSALDEKQRATECFSQALQLERSVMNRSSEAVTLSNLAYSWSSSDPDLAILFGKQAVNVLQSIRRDNKSLQESLRFSYEKSIEGSYKYLANLLVLRERFGEAEEVLDLLKDKEASDFIRRDSVSDQLHSATLLDSEKKALARYDQIVDQVGDLGQKKAALLAKADKGQLTPAELAEEAKLDQDLNAANTVLQKFLDEEEKALAPTSAEAKRVGELKEAEGLQDALAKLGPDVVAIYTLVTPDKYVALLVTPGARKAYTSPIKEVDLNKKIFDFRQQLQNPNSDPRSLARELYGIVFPEGLRHDLDAIHAKTIMWSIDSTLRYIPFAALYDGHDYLVQSFRQSLITPASIPYLTQEPLQQWTGIGFGVSDGAAGASPLPSVPGELHGIFRETADGNSPIPGVVLLNAAFTHQSFADDLRQKRNPVVHIATHFDSRPGVAANSSLLLGDGLLSLADIESQTRLFNGVDLLTLSACNTAFTNKSEDGREVDSFGTIAQRLGAKGVIASLWSVNDDSTATLMQTMYRLRQQFPGMTKDEALREAQLALVNGKMKPTPGKQDPDRGALPNRPNPAGSTRSNWTHPYYWAPFILIGNWK